MRFLKQSLILLLSFVLVYVWEKTPLSAYTVQAFCLLMVIFLLISLRRKTFDASKTLGEDGTWSIFLLNTLIFLLIYSTGGFSSTLYFLLYFLGFGIAFVFEPGIVFVFVLGVGLVFLEEAIKNDVFRNMIMLGSLVFLSPLAYFFGREYRKNEEQTAEVEALQERSSEAANEIAKDVEEIMTNKKDTLKSEDVEKLNEILEETEDLREE